MILKLSIQPDFSGTGRETPSRRSALELEHALVASKPLICDEEFKLIYLKIL